MKTVLSSIRQRLETFSRLLPSNATVADIPILLTTAVHVSAGKTALTDAALREEAIIVSLKHWAKLPWVTKIVICDGSNFDFTPAIKDLLLSQPGLKIECLSFQNDTEAVGRYGKGYGEGEIISYALENSRILANAPAFAKCTGKLWVANFEACAKRFDGRASFLLSGRRQVNYVDTRFYIVSKKFFCEQLLHGYVTVRDNEGHYLEHAYAEALEGETSDKVTIWPAPNIEGLSGSSGETYVNTTVGQFRLGMRCLSYVIWPRQFRTQQRLRSEASHV